VEKGAVILGRMTLHERVGRSMLRHYKVRACLKSGHGVPCPYGGCYVEEFLGWDAGAVP
jgi:hypothetical protein